MCARAIGLGGGVSGLARRWMRCVITTYHVNAPAMVIARLEHSHAVNFAIPPRAAPRRATLTEVFLLSAGGTGPEGPLRSSVSRIKEMENSWGRGTLKGTKRKRRVLRPDGDISIFVSDGSREGSYRIADRAESRIGWIRAIRADDSAIHLGASRICTGSTDGHAAAAAATCESAPLVSAETAARRKSLFAKAFARGWSRRGWFARMQPHGTETWLTLQCPPQISRIFIL